MHSIHIVNSLRLRGGAGRKIAQATRLGHGARLRGSVPRLRAPVWRSKSERQNSNVRLLRSRLGIALGSFYSCKTAALPVHRWSISNFVDTSKYRMCYPGKFPAETNQNFRVDSVGVDLSMRPFEWDLNFDHLPSNSRDTTTGR